MDGVGDRRRLVEIGPAGLLRDYGRFPITLNDPRSPGIWHVEPSRSVLVAVRLLDRPRYALLAVRKDRGARIIQASNSLTQCSFAGIGSVGVCVQQGLTEPPKLVTVDAETAAIESVRDLAPEFRQIAPLRYKPMRWVDAMGFTTTGFLIYPRHYREGVRYPLIIVTHGSDADERFLAEGMQWNYPVQAFAERGYAVALVNDPSPTQSDQLDKAYAAWADCGRGVAPVDVQSLIWLSAVSSYRALVTQLTGDRLVDQARIGIAGYSRGSQMVNVAMTQTNLFAAGSSGDGGYLEPAAYRFNVCGYGAVYGGPASSPAQYPLYRRLAPTFRADLGHGALLQQLAEPRAGAADLYQSWQATGRPSRITLYKGRIPSTDETHIFHIPANRLAAMQENMEWFDRWLGVPSVQRDRPE